MSVTANLTTNVETITATIVVEDETIIVQVSAAARGPAGATGPAGPNTLTTATTTNLDGFISGNGTNISGATAAASAATANTLVLRDANGGASFGPLSALAGSGNQHSITSSAGTNIVGPLALSGSTGDTLTATYNAAITLNSTTGVNLNGGPLTLTHTWTDAAVTFTGLQVNVTDTASAAASLLMDLQVGGVSRFRVDKTGTFTGTYRIHPTGPTLFSGQAGVWSFTYFGTPRFRVDAQRGFVCTPGSGFLWSGTSNDASGASDLLLLRDAANTLAQRNGTAAQESRIYGTYTGAGDYRRLALKMSTAGVAQIVAEGAGSGAVGNVLQLPANTTFADAPATRTALGLGTGDSPTFAMVNIGNSSLIADQDLDIRTPSGIRLVRLSRRGSNRGGISFANGSGGGYEIGFQWLSSTVVELNSGTVGATRGLKISDLEATGTVQTGGYTFSTLPTPTQGMRTFITDGADVPLFMANAAGGGSTVTPVFYNGTNWINA